MNGFSAGFSGGVFWLPQADWRAIAATALMAALLVGAGPSLPERPDGHDAVWSQSANAGPVLAESAPVHSIVAQSTGSAPPHEAVPGRPGFDKSGLGLSPAQKRIIYENTSGDRNHPLPADQPMVVGSGIPDVVTQSDAEKDTGK